MAERTLLQMVNSLKQKLRGGDALSTLPTGDLQVDTYVSLLNEAGREILEGRDWSFDRREGILHIQKRLTGTAFGFSAVIPGLIESNECSVEMTEATEILTAYEIAGNHRSRLVVTNSNTPSVAYSINACSTAVGRLNLVLDTSYYGGAAANNGTWIIYANEYLLVPPATPVADYLIPQVRKVLTIRDEDQPITLEFVDADFDLNQHVPRHHDTFSDQIDVAFVHPQISNTKVTAEASIPYYAGLTALGVILWPIPLTERALTYTYLHLHQDLSAETDTFSRVPENVVRLIEWRALEMAYASIEKDPAQAQIAGRMVREKYASAEASDERAPSRRRIPPMFGTRRAGPTNRRWASQLITP